MTETTRDMIRELDGEACRCGRPKGKGKTFCYTCYRKLPQSLQESLYSRVGNGYEEAYAESVAVLDQLGRPANPHPAGVKMRALTVHLPWALAIFEGKDIENRDWPTHIRGRIAIHAGKTLIRETFEEDCRWMVECAKFPRPYRFEDMLPLRGCVLGTVDLVDCVRGHRSAWFQGQYGFVLKDARRFAQPAPARGAQGFWFWNLPAGLKEVA